MAPEERASEKDLSSWHVCAPDCLSEVGGDDEGVREGKKGGESSTLEHLGVKILDLVRGSCDGFQRQRKKTFNVGALDSYVGPWSAAHKLFCKNYSRVKQSCRNTYCESVIKILSKFCQNVRTFYLTVRAVRTVMMT